MTYSTITVKPFNPSLGAEIFGVDLTRPLATQQVEEIQKALLEHLVIVFRDQKLDHAAHSDFASRFGAPARPSDPSRDSLRAYRVDGFPEIVSIHADEHSTFVAGEDWHSDMTCLTEPPLGSVLYLHTVPEYGGDTAFANMYAAYDALSERMKVHLEGLTAFHDGRRVFGKVVTDPGASFPAAHHPVVRTHPESGRKALFVNKHFTAHIDDVSEDESNALLNYLYLHCMRPEFQMRVRWKPHTVTFWDNRSVQHSAIWDYFPKTRSGFRVQIRGDQPV